MTGKNSRLLFFVMCSLLMSASFLASAITPSEDVWQDEEGNIYYQNVLKQVNFAGDHAPSVQLYQKFPYVKLVKNESGDYETEFLTKDDFLLIEGDLLAVGNRLAGDFDGDGATDYLIQSADGQEILISRHRAKPFKVGESLTSLVNSGFQLLDVNGDNRVDFHHKGSNQVLLSTDNALTRTASASSYVGTLPGDSNVSPSGDFTYRVPIMVAESSGDLKPDVAFSYSSQPINGQLGVGWGIEGLSAISRCEQNKELDGTAKKVNFTPSDRFCLDGRRLLVKNGHTYGANGSEYRLEQDQGHKVHSYTSDKNKGPDYFLLYDKQGNKFTYGKSSASIRASNGRIFSWALRKVEDASGNYYLYSYNKVANSLEYTVNEINYSGNSQSTRNKIKFLWEDRTDNQKFSYVHGEKITLTRRLKSVESYYSNNLLRRYNLAYSYAFPFLGSSTQSRLMSIQACDDSNQCLEPTRFRWSTRRFGDLRSAPQGDYSKWSRYKGHQFIDFNGDGLKDIAYVRNDRGSSSDHLFMIPKSSNPNHGFGYSKNIADIASFDFRKTWKVIDYNKDGQEDILYLSGSKKWKLLEYTPSAREPFTTTTLKLPSPSSSSNTRFVDIDGDGHPELIHIVNDRLSYHPGTKTGVDPHQKTFSVRLNAPSNGSARLLGYDQEDNTFPAVDFNGDGHADFLVQVEKSRRYSGGGGGGGGSCRRERCNDPRALPIDRFSTLSNNVASTSDAGLVSSASGNSGALSPVDDNQLHVVDLVYSGESEHNLVAQQKEQVNLPLASQQSLVSEASFVSDFSATTRTSYWVILTSNGDNVLSEYVSLGTTEQYSDVQAADINGDGLPDILYKTKKSDNSWYVRFNNGRGFNSAIYIGKFDTSSLAVVDINGDGVSEIFWTREYEKDGYNIQGDVFLFFNGSGFVPRRFHSAGGSDYHWRMNYVDVNGDAVPDRLHFAGRASLSLNTDAGSNRIVSVTDGFGAVTSVEYGTITDRSLYTPDTDASGKAWGNFGRITDLKSSIRVVKSLRKDNDKLSYRYVGAKAQAGRGLLGYRVVTIESKNAGTRVVSFYRQDGIYRGSVAQMDTYVSLNDSAKNSSGSGGGSGGVYDPCDSEPKSCACKNVPGCHRLNIIDPIDGAVAAYDASPVETASDASGDTWRELTASNYKPTPESHRLAFDAALPASATAAGTASPDNTQWRLQSSVIRTYSVRKNTDFRIKQGNRVLTTASIVYPKKMVTYRYNTDNANKELLASHTQTESIDAYGNPTHQTETLTSANGNARETTVNRYNYSHYAGRLYQSTKTERYTNKINGSQRGSERSVSLTTNFEYDNKGRLVAEIADNGVRTEYSLNTAGQTVQTRVRSMVNGLEDRVSYATYDSSQRHKISTRNALNHTTTTGYDSFGRQSYVQTANGQRTYFNYNSMGRLISEVATPADNHSQSGAKALTTSKSQYWCSSVNHCPVRAVYVEEVNAEGKPSTRVYKDRYGRELRTASKGFSGGQWIIKDISYDARGRKMSETAPYLTGTAASNIPKARFEYDSQNRVIKVTKPDGGVWLTRYNGESTTTENPEGHTHTQIKNSADLLVKVTDANRQSAEYLYDALGNSIQLKDPAGNTITVSYDKYGNKTQLHDPDKGKVSYVYNVFHELMRQTDAMNNVVSFEYDKLGRQVLIRRHRGRDNRVEQLVRTQYDSGSYAKGQVFKQYDSISGYTLRHYYDAYSRLRERHTLFDGAEYKEKWSFNNAGQPFRDTDATGNSVEYTYNASNHLYRIYDHQTRKTVWQASEADAWGNITLETLGGRITRTKLFDENTGLLRQLRAEASGTLQSLDYDWDDLGNLEYRRDNRIGKSENFDYDGLNRVTESHIVGGETTEIRYNNLGNITYKTAVGSYYYESNRPHAVTRVSGERANRYAYDANGNMIRDAKRTLVYNTYDKPIEVRKSEHNYKMLYSYGVTGSRYKLVEFGHPKGLYVPIMSSGITTIIPLPKETRFVGKVEFVRAAGSGEWVQKRYIANNVLITSAAGFTKTRFVLNDHLGSTHVIANSSGAIEEQMSFDVFGARRNPSTWARRHHEIAKYSSDTTSKGYTGHEQMDEVALVHMGGRIYDPVLGRFLQADPMIQAPENIQSLNRYSYVLNNPLNATDPSGYVAVAIAVWALKAAVTKGLVAGVTKTVIVTVLKAYQYYGYVQLAISTYKAIDGGGTAIANFLGGFVKAQTEGAALTCALDAAIGDNCLKNAENKDSPTKTGNSFSDLKDDPNRESPEDFVLKLMKKEKGGASAKSLDLNPLKIIYREFPRWWRDIKSQFFQDMKGAHDGLGRRNLVFYGNVNSNITLGSGSAVEKGTYYSFADGQSHDYEGIISSDGFDFDASAAVGVNWNDQGFTGVGDVRSFDVGPVSVDLSFQLNSSKFVGFEIGFSPFSIIPGYSAGTETSYDTGN